MKDKHIINIIEGTPFAALSESELAEIRMHIVDCAGCSHAFEAAEITAILLHERAAETVEPPPFFQTRVLAQLRERKSENEGWNLMRLWRSAGALASTMVLTVATLGVVTLMMPANTGAQEMSAAYTAETLILNQSELSDDQVLSTIYGPDEDAVK